MNSIEDHLKNLPTELVEILKTEFQELHQEYFLGRWKPSQLDGGRFAETIFRILEYKNRGCFTAIGSQLQRSKITSSVKKNTKLPESLRFHIIGLAELIFDFRNKRNVGHIGLIDVNEMDATFVLQAANWIVAELIRLETQMSPEEAHDEIKKIIERKAPIVEEIGGRLKCLDPNLKTNEKALVFCYQKYPNKISFDDLFDWTEHSNKTVLKKGLRKISKDGLIDFRDNEVMLTKRGLLWVEKNIHFEIVI